MNMDEKVIYDHIEMSGREGIWTKTLKTRANAHQSTMLSCLKSLQAKNLIKNIKSVKYPARKMYMISTLTPSEETAGGPWYTDGELDVDMIQELSRAVYKYMEVKSYHQLKSTKQKPSRGTIDGDKVSSISLASLKGWDSKFIPHKAGYPDYSRVDDVMLWLNETKLMNAGDFGYEHTEQLLEMLRFDGKLERVKDTDMYRLVRPFKELNGGVSHSLMEIPCGRCEVFNLCEDGGPVNANNCNYFKDWLDF
jgi:DNA-directed RNA polymerase III subunit RPC6